MNTVISPFPFDNKVYRNKNQKVLKAMEDKKPSEPIVRFVPIGTPNSTSIGIGSCFWNRKLCKFEEQEAVHYLNRYREWFFAQLDADPANSLNMTLTVMENVILSHGAIKLGCDQHAKSNHGMIIKEYLEWSTSKRLEAKKVPLNSPFVA